MSTVTHIGGYMYGDGEYVVSFHNVNSMGSPLKATILAPGGKTYEWVGTQTDKPSVKLASEILASVHVHETMTPGGEMRTQ